MYREHSLIVMPEDPINMNYVYFLKAIKHQDVEMLNVYAKDMDFLNSEMREVCMLEAIRTNNRKVVDILIDNGFPTSFSRKTAERLVEQEKGRIPYDWPLRPSIEDVAMAAGKENIHSAFSIVQGSMSR